MYYFILKLVLHITNLLNVIIHVVKKFWTLHCQKCAKNLKEEKKNHPTHAIEHMFFSCSFSSSWIYQNLNNLFQHQILHKDHMVFNNCNLYHEIVKQQALTIFFFLFRQKLFFLWKLILFSTITIQNICILTKIWFFIMLKLPCCKRVKWNQLAEPFLMQCYLTKAVVFRQD